MPEAHKRAYCHPKYKTSYRVNNWPEYDKSLRDRGDVTLWISHEATNAWTPPHNGQRGAQPRYADIAIETALSLRLLFNLPLRRTEGFLCAILTLMDLALPCPDHTTVSRRNGTLDLRRQSDRAPEGPIALIVDSTGLKVCARFVGDGIYDQEPVYAAVLGRSPGAQVPRKDAVLSAAATTSPSQCDQHLLAIASTDWLQWKRMSGYYDQSRAENAFARWKRIFGGRLRAKREAAQEREASLICLLLNRMLKLGRPPSYSVRYKRGLRGHCCCGLIHATTPLSYASLCPGLTAVRSSAPAAPTGRTARR